MHSLTCFKQVKQVASATFKQILYSRCVYSFARLDLSLCPLLRRPLSASWSPSKCQCLSLATNNDVKQPILPSRELEHYTATILPDSTRLNKTLAPFLAVQPWVLSNRSNASHKFLVLNLPSACLNNHFFYWKHLVLTDTCSTVCIWSCVCSKQTAHVHCTKLEHII